MHVIKAGPIRILGISGSPRNMATEFLVQEALRITRNEYEAETSSP
jgi:multimeric flavodoxin WrbA